ncbi:MAG: ubiquinone/menaquinone biosynthesis methyltransferase [Spirochaetales bacterium]|nr:ubiquinone/menaquinone biosynthesis methyltransferase [Spirochaetales bacterium]
MNKNRQFLHKLKDFKLTEPESKKEYNEILFSPVSRVYSIITILLSFGRDKSWKRRLIRMLPLVSAPRVIDLACGPGDICFLIARKYKMARVIGVDLNQGMLEKAEENLKKSYPRFRNRITFKKGDMNHLEYVDSSFDVLTGSYALRNAPDLGSTLDEIRRVLKPGGTAAFLDFSKSHLVLLQKIQLSLLSFWGRLWGLVFHGNAEVYGYIAESLKEFPDARAFSRLVETKGFKIKGKQSFFFGLLCITVAEKIS